MKKIISSLIIIIPFLILIFVPTILYLTAGENTEDTLDEKRETENFPIDFDNDYFVKIEKWYKDNAPYRMTIITKQKEISQTYGIEYRNIIHPKLSAALSPAWYDDPYRERTGLEGVSFLAPIEDSSVFYGRNNWLFYTGDNSIGYFEGTNLLSDEEMQVRSDLFLQLYNVCQKKGIQLVYLTGPNKEQMYTEKMPSYYIANLPKREELFANYLIEKGVPYIYPLNKLSSYKDQYAVYYQQDTHWNEVGAYLAVMEVYKQLGLPVTPIEDIEVNIKEKKGGDLSDFCGYSTTYTDYSVVYKPDINYSVESIFEGNVDIFNSDNGNNRNMVIIGDSFRNACKTYFAKDFKNTVVLHRGKINEEIVIQSLQNLKAGDVLLILAVERYDNSHVDVTKRLLEIL